MAETLKKIIDYLNENNLDKAYELCDQNTDKKIEHVIKNIKGVILLKRKNELIILVTPKILKDK